MRYQAALFTELLSVCSDNEAYITGSEFRRKCFYCNFSEY
ncbi:protein of unknown function [Vibrio tapetis subsp. tapetis]|uniref:Uncharacterized protein n=1 Tax=Vibrio tapetis subsp. tapetis TaxID=1671868 RepID=A0A2N8ZBW0_9VIBR|nr:protein of unknown function [Vibrio tapetis subsp. tapetis]